MKRFFLIVATLVTTVGLYAQAPVADFTGNPLSGCAPLFVRFTNTSTGPSNTYFWDLGNGVTTPATDASTTYFTPGTYTVKLIATNGSGIDSIVRTNYITVLPSPIVDFVADDTVGCFPQNVHFTDKTNPLGGTITSWLWDFGDGSSSTQQNPFHDYRIDNRFNVTLTVTSNSGCVGTYTRNTYINVTPGVTVNFFNSFASSCKPPSSIDFFNATTGPGTISYQWRFGDGGTGAGTNVTHIYNAVGSYPVTLIASSSDGCTDSTMKPVDIPDVNITSKFNAPDTGCVNQGITFTNTSFPPADSSGWKFGDGTFTSGNVAVKTYGSPGTYNVTLVNLYGNCLDSVARKIVVIDTPKVDFFTADTANCRAPYTVNFSDRSTGAVGWSWDFGDGTPADTRQNPQHVYNAPGAYTVTLTVTNKNGCTNSRKKISYIKIAGPSLTFTNLPDSGCVPLTVTPTVLINAVDGVNSYFWNFGDGFTSSSYPVSHTYNAQGNYTVSLAITTNSGCFQTLSLPNAVKLGVSPVANFSASPLLLCAGQPVNFKDLSTGTVTGWLWDFGDTANKLSNYSTLQNPVYQYTDTGLFTVKLTVFNNGCGNQLMKPQYIQAYGAVARFGYKIQDCSVKTRVNFYDSSLNAASIVWNFGDGSPTTTVPNPVHNFPGLGTYNVTLTATQGGCTYVLVKRVRLVNENANYVYTPNTLCRGSVVKFTAAAIDSNIAKYEWDIGNGVFFQDTREIFRSFDTSKTYHTRLAITDINGCTDTVNRNLAVGGPRAGFQAINPTGCVGITVNFTDTSKSDGVNPIVSHIWDFGDGAIQTINGPPVSHQYITNGFFNVKLRVVDAVGCTDSMIQNSLVVASSPRAQFTSPDSMSCPGKPVLFLTNSTGAINSHFWTFGDGNTSPFRNPTNTYAAAGKYTVKLRVLDRFGCADSITKTNYINIDTPYAAFTISDSVGTCPPLIVHFTNTGSYFNKVRWDFDDGGISPKPDTPSHQYTAPGVYFPRLIVTSPGGCTDTAFKKITLFGPNGTLDYTPLGGCLPATINFTVHAKDADSVIWDFRDGISYITTDTTQSHTYTKDSVFVPQVILKDVFGCKVPVVGTNQIVVVGFKTGFAASSQLLCDNGTVTFRDTTKTYGTINTWDWDFGDGTTGLGRTVSHFYSGPGLYSVKLKVTTQFGCTDSVTLPNLVKVVASPVTAIQSADTLCQNRFMTYQGVVLVPDTSALRWSWNFGNGDTSALQNPVPVQYRIPGPYTVRMVVTNSSGCQDTVLKNININPLPLIDAGLDSTICLGQSIQLNATGANQYQWLPPNTSLGCTNCPNPIATPPLTTTYLVKGITSLGCEKTDSVTVYVVQPSTVKAPPDDSLCFGQGIQLFATGTQVYSWSPATGLNNPFTSSPIARPASSITYVVTGSDSRSCFTTTDSVRVTVFPIPAVNAGPDITIPVGSSVQLNANPSADVVGIWWTPAGSLSCTGCSSPIATPKARTVYSVTVTNNGGCTNTDDVTVLVTCSNENLFIPNTFSPNGDGMNEVFYPRGRGITTIKSMRIFSRWGQQVFQRTNFNANDISAGWDGTFKGQKLQPDVYVYYIEVLCENNSFITLKGDVTLVR